MLIPKKKLLLLVQKALNYRRIDDVMKAFAEINVLPISIRKRHNVKQLKSLYSYLLVLLEKMNYNKVIWKAGDISWTILPQKNGDKAETYYMPGLGFM